MAEFPFTRSRLRNVRLRKVKARYTVTDQSCHACDYKEADVQYGIHIQYVLYLEQSSATECHFAARTREESPSTF